MIVINLVSYEQAAGKDQTVTRKFHVLNDQRIAVLFLGEKSFQRASTTHAASYSIGDSRSFPRGSKTDYSATSNDEIKNTWRNSYPPPYALVEKCLIQDSSKC